MLEHNVTQVEIKRPQEEGSTPAIDRTGELVLRFAVDQNDPTKPEIFDTIQGEGRNIGTPVVFARLSGCNLQCSWCDTPYTWAFSDSLASKHDEGVAYSKSDEQISLHTGEAIDQISGYPIKRLVITGGEPMLQQKGIAQLVADLKKEDPNYWVEIETNGTIVPSPEMLLVIDQFNVSPKLSNSGNNSEKRDREGAMKVFAGTPKADFKFVVSDKADILDILELTDHYDIKPNKVFLMPEGRTEEEVQSNSEQLVEVAKHLGFNVTTRLHILIWGPARGK